MAVISGFTLESFGIVEETGTSSNLSDYVFLDYPYDQEVIDFVGSGAIISPGAASTPEVLSAWRANHFDGDYFNQIHVIPVVADVGTITGDASLGVELFNAFLTSKSLTGIDEFQTTGVSLTGITAPVTLDGNESIQFFVNASTLGPAEIDATFTFVFTPAIAGSVLSVIGTRIITFPYRFAPELIETLETRSNVMTARDGSERRQAVRANYKQKFSGESFIPSTELIRATNLFYDWRDKIWAVPIQSESSIIISDVSDLDVVINVDTEFADYRVDGLAIIWKNPRNFQTFEVDSFTSTTLTSKQPINGEYIGAIVAPIRSCRMISNPVLATNGYDGKVKFSFEVNDNKLLTSSLSTQPFGDGIEVFEEQPLSSSNALNSVINADITTIDFKTGPVESFSNWLYKKPQRTFTLITETKEEAWNIRLWLHRRYGKVIPFYMPTFQNDFEVLNTSVIVTSISVKANDHSKHGSDRIGIGLLTISSGWVYAKITSIVDNEDGTESFSLGSSISVLPEDITISSYVGLKRLSSDRLKIKWEANNVAIFNIPEIEILP